MVYRLCMMKKFLQLAKISLVLRLVAEFFVFDEVKLVHEFERFDPEFFFRVLRPIERIQFAGFQRDVIRPLRQRDLELRRIGTGARVFLIRVIIASAAGSQCSGRKQGGGFQEVTTVKRGRFHAAILAQA